MRAFKLVSYDINCNVAVGWAGLQFAIFPKQVLSTQATVPGDAHLFATFAVVE